MQVGTVAIAAAFGNWQLALGHAAGGGEIRATRYGLRATGQVLNAKF